MVCDCIDIDVGRFLCIRRFYSTILADFIQELGRVLVIDKGNNGLNSVRRVEFDRIIQQLLDLPFIIAKIALDNILPVGGDAYEPSVPFIRDFVAIKNCIVKVEIFAFAFLH